MLASLEDMRLENRRLLEKERQLEANFDQSEEQLRALQTENSSLLSQLQRLVESHVSHCTQGCDKLCMVVCSMQQELLKVEVVEREKSSVAQSCKSSEVTLLLYKTTSFASCIMLPYKNCKVHCISNSRIQVIKIGPLSLTVREEEGRCQLLQESAEKMVRSQSVQFPSFIPRFLAETGTE